jgi:beta-lactamase class D
MIEEMHFRSVLSIIFSFSFIFILSAEESFMLIDAVTDERIEEMGPDIDKYYSPCSSFKIPLALMGYDAGILKDENSPIWEFQEGYECSFPSWMNPQSPISWMKCSCVWYSKLLSLELGLEALRDYLVAFEYGNQNVLGGLVEPGPLPPLWINSSLLISPREQVQFIQKMVLKELPVSSSAFEKTKTLLFKEDLVNEWKLYGKTGAGSDIPRDGKKLDHSWFVGWIEKGDRFLPFAYLIRSEKINFEQRIPRVKELIIATNVMED